MKTPHATQQAFEDICRSTESLFGVFSGVRREAETIVRERMRKVLDDINLVQRDEFNAMEDLVAAQQERIMALEAALAAQNTAPKKAAPKKKNSTKASKSAGKPADS